MRIARRFRAPRLRTLLAAATVVLPVALAGPVTPASACSNEAVRTQQGSAYLPDCRGFEQVSPVAKDGEEVNTPHRHGREIAMQAAAVAPAVAYMLSGGEPNSKSAGTFIPDLSEGGGPGSGWLARAIAAENRFAVLIGPSEPRIGNEFHFFSRNLGCGVETTALPQAASPSESTSLWPEGESKSEGIENIYTWDRATNTKALVTDLIPVNPTHVRSSTLGYYVDGASETCERVLYEASEEAYDAPGAPEHSLYEWTRAPGSSTGTPAIASVLPSGKAATRVLPAEGGTKNGHSTYNMISRDGRKVFFVAFSDGQGPGETAESGHQEVYLREQGSSAAREISGPEEKEGKREGQPDQGAAFQAATPNGEKVFFNASYGLTSAGSKGAEAATFCTTATPGGGSTTGAGCDLYEYNTLTNHLTDLTADVEGVEGSADKKGANVRSVLGISEAGDYVYLTASGQLQGKGHTEAENEAKSEVNLFVEHAGHIFEVTQLGAGETYANVDATQIFDAIANPISGGMAVDNARVSQDGQYLTFPTSLTKPNYNNVDKETGKAVSEFYEYHFGEGTPAVSCISCNPSGEPPGYNTGALSAGPETLTQENYDGALSTTVLNDGRAFFQSTDRLLEQAANAAPNAESKDTEKALNVYQWTPGGSGSCSTPTGKAAGCIQLLDSGTDPDPTYLIGSSLSGEHVYLTTYSQLAPEIDLDGLRDVYDVREGGGFLPPAGAKNCEPGCQGEGTTRSPYGHSSEAKSGVDSSKAVVEGKSEVESFKASTLVLSKHSTKGSTVTLVVSAPSAGLLAVSGPGLVTVHKAFSKAGRYTIKVSLAAKGRTAVRHHHKVKTRVKLSFAPTSGKASSAALTVTFR